MRGIIKASLKVGIENGLVSVMFMPLMTLTPSLRGDDPIVVYLTFVNTLSSVHDKGVKKLVQKYFFERPWSETSLRTTFSILCQVM